MALVTVLGAAVAFAALRAISIGSSRGIYQLLRATIVALIVALRREHENVRAQRG